jgi:DNA polymerase (family 10)
MISNYEIARIFSQIADLMEVRDENPFKVRAYRKAADTIEGLTESLETIAARGELEKIPNIGKAIAEKIADICRTGTTPLYEELRGNVPAGLVEVMAVPGIGPSKVRALHEALGVTTLDALEAAGREQRIRGVSGMGAKTEENILHAIEAHRRRSDRWPLGKALPYAEALAAALAQSVDGLQIDVLGSIRRRVETIGDIDMGAVSTEPERVMSAFVQLPHVKEVLVSGPASTRVRTHEGMQVDLRVARPEDFGFLVHHFTGSRAHNIRLREIAEKRGARISEYGIFEAGTDREIATGEDEGEVYRFLGLPFIPPELREDRGEIAAAQAGTLPTLITETDIRGNLHTHSTWSDGAVSIEAMAAAARARGHAYIAITDHSKRLGITNGLDEARLREQMAEIDRLNAAATDGFRILTGSEVDILPDGALDLDTGLLAELDFVIASVHSGFKQDEETMTARVIRAMESGVVDMIAHPTGRLLGARDPYAIDLDRLYDVAVATQTALEINAFPDRLDLNDVNARRARDRGVKISINTDAHHPDHLGLYFYGIATARRAWLQAEDVLNTWELPGLKRWLETRRG